MPPILAWRPGIGPNRLPESSESARRARPRQRTIENSPGFQAWVNDGYEK
jgi:hypothetical protein